MNLVIERFVSSHPRLYHMAEAGSWASIQRHGLLSTSALLDLFEITGRERFAIESQWRPQPVAISHRIHGTAVIRDQKPMPPDSLAKVLENTTPQEWYEFLNRKSFFWVTQERLNRLLGAKHYREHLHDVITVDTALLVEQHLGRITLSPINSGVSAFGPVYQRKPGTFKPIQCYTGAQLGRVVELVVDYKVSEIAELAISVDLWRGRKFERIIWNR